MHGDTIVINVKGSIPAKTYAPKEVVTLTPVIKWNGGEKALKPIVFQGEKVKEGKAIVVAKKTETGFTYNERVAYQPEMKVAEFTAKASVAKKEKVKKEVEVPKMADMTIVTPLLAMSDEQPIMGTEKMPRIIPMAIDGDVHFEISQAKVRDKELKADDMKALLDFLKNSQTPIMDEKGKKVLSYKKNYDIKGISISAYASPDGETDKNANLSQDRGKATAADLSSFLKKNGLSFLVEKVDTQITESKSGGKPKQTINKTSLEESFYQISSTPEDWEGFKQKMEASSVPDKEMILRILSTYSDNDKREQEIKNISMAYTEIKDQILPGLRRSKISVSAEKKCKTDAELSQMAISMADSLTNEELMYAASITQDMNTQISIYTNLSRVHPNDWRGPNNLGCLYLMQNKISEAGAQFEKAAKIEPSNPAILNNLGIIAMKNGDRNKAAELYSQAMSAGSQPSYNMGRINILRGKYGEAVSNYAGANTFNAALAKLLNGNADGAMSTLEGGKDADTPMGHYLKAVISARKSDAGGVVKHLNNAFAKDASLKEFAKKDMEFRRLSDETVKALLQ
jgi:tetratricopeptide (TPR) repeat protein